jgi:hypothetical protein
MKAAILFICLIPLQMIRADLKWDKVELQKSATLTTDKVLLLVLTTI